MNCPGVPTLIAPLARAGAGPARADSECVQGVCDLSAADHAGMGATLEAAKRALPPTPVAWAITIHADSDRIEQMIDQFDFGVFAGGLQDWPISRCGRKTAFPW